jgi:hypothetical protein
VAGTGQVNRVKLTRPLVQSPQNIAKTPPITRVNWGKYPSFSRWAQVGQAGKAKASASANADENTLFHRYAIEKTLTPLRDTKIKNVSLRPSPLGGLGIG